MIYKYSNITIAIFFFVYLKIIEKGEAMCRFKHKSFVFQLKFMHRHINLGQGDAVYKQKVLANMNDILERYIKVSAIK